MTKSFIALKTTLRGKSIWAIHPAICQTYRVGERVKCKDPLFPFFICSLDALTKSANIACGADYTEFLIIQVFASELSHIMPWVNVVNEETLRELDLSDTFESFQGLYAPRYPGARANRVDHQFTAQRLKVLASFSEHCNAEKALKEWSRKMHLPILTANDYIKLHPECSRE